MAWLAALAFAVPIVPSGAADDPPGPLTVPSEPVFEALKLDGTTTAGRLARLEADGRVVLVADEVETAIPLDELVKLTRDGDPPEAPPAGPLAVFPDGDRLVATASPIDGTRLPLRAEGLAEPTVVAPLESLVGLVLNPPEDPEAAETLLDRLRREPREADTLWLANGDTLTGGLLGLDAHLVRFQGGAGPVELPRSGVVALGFDPALARYPRPEGTYLELTTLDGSRLGVTGATLSKGQIQATSRFGAPIRLDLGRLARIHVRSERIVDLSEREPAAVRYFDYVGPPRPFRRDASVVGTTLRLAGQPFDRGLGTQSRTLLAYKLDPSDRRFQALVGLDAAAGPLGSVVFRVYVDKDVRFTSPPLSALDPPVAIDVEVRGGGALILETDFGRRGSVQDLADWAEARLIR